MGNYIECSFLEQPVSPVLLFLTKWTSTEIARFFKNCVASQESSGFFVTKQILKFISKDTPLKNNEEVAYTYFRTSGYSKVNFMELMASIITYSLVSWQVKVKLAFLAFDFDESKTITKDEMVIMIISFVKGIGTMTNTVIYNTIDLENLAKHCFKVADSNPDGMITLEELTHWVAMSVEVLTLLQKTQSKQKKLINATVKINRRAQSKEQETDTTLFKRRQSISISFTGRKIVKRSVPKKHNKSDREWIDIPELQSLFNKVVTPYGNATIGQIYEVLAENNKFAQDLDYFFHEFSFDTRKSIKFSDLLNYIRKRRAKTGYSFIRGNIMFADLNSVEKPRLSKRTNQEVLKKMFASFDKNSDGYITMDELTNGLKKDFSLRTIQEMFASYDKDHNKVLDFDEFLEMFTKDSPSLSPKKK
ncbi:hypothetical protein SteCoe_11189 [Stentor coeruleus]|uniref:EF-hand domain-containing protein n=1 Tax=Stentor coeruleus TaxID=5963 RepID=A0A1R2CDU4_9CILI|nr:hypothetical protein SteCoe_11189 [Stentor coeruleus]